MWAKICANTTLEDALAAAHLGADALGFVFAPSKRQVTPAQVRQISLSLPRNLERVGVFPTLPPDQIAAAATEANLTTLQLHGGYDPILTRALTQLLPHIDLIQTVHWTIGEDQASLAAATESLSKIHAQNPTARVLIDAKIGHVSGGLGQTFNWSAARPLFTLHPTLRLILAGGLTPFNVAEAIHTLHPWGVDVASGVESTPGHKDPTKLQSFLQAAHSTP